MTPFSYIGDVLAPQGLAKKVSNAQAIALAIIITGLIISAIARAPAYYLETSIAIDAANYLS